MCTFVNLVKENRLKAFQVLGKSLIIISTDREETWKCNGRRNDKFRTQSSDKKHRYQRNN